MRFPLGYGSPGSEYTVSYPFMRVPSTSSLAITYALSDPDIADRALAALAGRSDPIAVAGLLDFLKISTNAQNIVTAVKLLSEIHSPVIDATLVRLLRSRWPSVQVAAVAALDQRGFVTNEWCRKELIRLVAEHSSWTLRRQALQASFKTWDPRLLVAASDPHWRVRHACVQICIGCWGEMVPDIVRQLQQLNSPHVRGVVQFLLRWRGEAVVADEISQPQRPPFWDEDPAVLERNIRAESKRSPSSTWSWLPQLAAHDEECVHRSACELLLQNGDAQQLAATANLLNEPRHAANLALVDLFARIDRFRFADVVSIIFKDEQAAPGAVAWAIDNSREARDEVNGADHVFIRRALARRATRRDVSLNVDRLLRFFDDEDAEVRFFAANSLTIRKDAPPEWCTLGLRDVCPAIRAICVSALANQEQISELTSVASDPWPEVRAAVAKEGIASDFLINDEDPQVRVAALTPEYARALWENPERETSWQVLAAASQMLRRPLWEIAPDPPWHPPSQQPVKQRTFTISLPDKPAHFRLLGKEKTPVSALALSGHYHLPAEGFAMGVDRGVNLFFWEPNYDTLTRFSLSISNRYRQQLHFIAGTFEATPQAIRRDAERAVRVLRLDRLDLFLLFWTRSWQRLDDAVRQELEELQRSGIVHMVGISTHNRALALEAINENWDPIMVRHSAAHRGAEAKVFPAATTKRTSLLAFNSTCYGRLLTPLADGTRVAVADCYRYTLSQPAVTSCLCAPATLPQLRENLQVLDNLVLTSDALAKLQKVGAHVYEEDFVFRQTLR